MENVVCAIHSVTDLFPGTSADLADIRKNTFLVCVCGHVH